MSYREHRIAVTRTARWGLLGELGAETSVMWLAFHGYGQLAAGFAAQTRWPKASHRAFVFPEALQRFYAADPTVPRRHRDTSVVASWMTREARADDIEDNNAYLDRLWGAVHAQAPRAAAVLIGFSQGGATAARWAAARAASGQPPARLIVWGSGLPEDTDLASSLCGVPITMVTGTRDRWVTSDRLELERARIAEARLTVDWRTFAGGHRIDDALLADLAEEVDAGLSPRP